MIENDTAHEKYFICIKPLLSAPLRPIKHMHALHGNVFFCGNRKLPVVTSRTGNVVSEGFYADAELIASHKYTGNCNRGSPQRSPKFQMISSSILQIKKKKCVETYTTPIICLSQKSVVQE